MIELGSVFVGQLIFLLSYFKIAKKFQIVDTPNGRSSHSTATIRGGGVIIFFSVLLHSLINPEDTSWVFVVALFAISVISFLDDIRPMSSLVRLTVQSTVVLVLLLDSSLIEWYFLIIGLILLLGYINMYNFMDGINGMSSSYSIVFFTTILYINFQLKIDTNFLTYLISGLLVFSIFNFRTKALCFLGDVGSVALGLITGFILLLLVIQSEEIGYFLFVAVYGIDAGYTILYRLFTGENILQAHRMHLYQLLCNELKIKHLTVSSLYSIIQFGINSIVIVSIRFINNEKYFIYAGLISFLLVINLLARRFVIRKSL